MTSSSWRPDWPVPARVQAHFYSREGGVSVGPFAGFNLASHVGDDTAAVRSNRQSLARELPAVSGFQWLQQVHSNKVVGVDSAGDVLTADGLVTTRTGLGCCILTADCLPVFFASKNGDEVGVAHAGWRGMAGGIIENVLMQMHSSPADVCVWLAPAIGPCHFEVGEDVCLSFAAVLPDEVIDECFKPAEKNGKYYADLYQLARRKLQALGVADISGGEVCTVCDTEHCYSYRRDGQTGRNLSLIYINP